MWTHTHSMCAHAHALIYSVMCTYQHMLKKTFFSSAFCLPFAPSSSRSLFLFPLTGSVSIRCDIPFCFLITSLYFVLPEPNNFIDDGHKPIHSLSRTACRHKYKFMVLGFTHHLLHLEPCFYLSIKVSGNLYFTQNAD